MLSFTYFLYLSIFLITTFLAFHSQKRMKSGDIVFDKRLLLCSFLIHWFFIAFTRTGVDHDQYIYIIQTDCERRLAEGEEVGFNGLCWFLHALTGNAEIVVLIIKTITLCIMYRVFYLIRYKANMGLTVLTYNVYQYLFSFCILAHSLAIALIVLAVCYMMFDYKWYRPLLLSLIASTIHASALVMVVLIVAIIIANWRGVEFGFTFVCVSFAAILFILLNISIVFEYAIENISSFNIYDGYSDSQNRGSGLFNYLLCAYIFIMLIIPIFKSTMKNNIKNISIFFYFFCVTSLLMGYFLGTARLNQYIFGLYGVAIPWYFFHIRNRFAKTRHFFSYRMQLYSWIFYLLFYGWGSLGEASDPSSTNELANYEFFNPFSWR